MTEAPVSVPPVNEPAEFVVSDIHVTFGGVRALAGASLRIAPGEVCGLVGPNGSGKSTFLNVMCGFVRPGSGSVHLGDVDLVGRPPHEIARLGVRRTFQLPRFNEQTTSMENVLAATTYRAGRHRGRTARRAARDEALAALTAVGAPEYAAWRTSALSHGTRRKVEFARALVAKPSVLLLDEPTSGVSLAHAELMRQQIFDLAATGVAVLLVDHDLAFVANTCSRTVVFDAGAVIFEGTPHEALADRRVVEAYIGV